MDTHSHVVSQGHYYSKSLGRNQPFLCLTPPGDTVDLPFLLLLHGRDGHFDHWNKYTRLRKMLLGLPYLVVCPEGGNGWYTNSFDGKELWEDDLVQDLLPYLNEAFPISQDTKHRIFAGASMGGFGAIKIALRHYKLFGTAISLAGGLAKPSQPGSHPIFGEYERDIAFRHRENLSYLAEQALCRFPSERPRLILDCGLEDPLIESNQHFSDHLNFLGYAHDFTTRRGHHTWPYFERGLQASLGKVFRII